MTAQELAWTAGIIEGEGSICYSRGSPSIKVEMTDRDVVERIAGILRVNVNGPRVPRGKDTYKPVWSCTVHGYRSIGWLMTLYLWLGKRRREAARGAINQWIETPGPARKVRGEDGLMLGALCHPNRPSHARRQCFTCYKRTYMKAWRHRTGRNSNFYRQRERPS